MTHISLESSGLVTNMPTDKHLSRLQIEAVYRQMPLVLLADVAAGCLLYILIQFESYNYSSLLWLVLLACVSTSRAWTVYSHSKNKKLDFVISKRWNFLIFGSLFSGVLWGLSWTLLPSEPTVVQINMVVLWSCGMVSGAAATLTVIRALFFVFVCPLYLFVAGFLLLIGDANSIMALSGFTVYFAVMIPIAMRINEVLNKSLRLQLDNEKLSSKLKIEGQKLQSREWELEETRGQELALIEQKDTANAELSKMVEERIRLLDAIEEGICGVDAQGYVTFVNSSALALLGLEEDEILKKDISTMFVIDRRSKSRQEDEVTEINAHIATGEPIHRASAIMRRTSTKSFPVRVSSKPLTSHSKVIGAVLSFTDVSEQNEMQTMLVQAQKMEAVGRVTGGVAHDFNNLLTVIIGNLQILERQLGEYPKSMSLVHNSLDAADSGAELINRLLSFSREQSLKEEALDANVLLANLRHLLERALGEKVQLAYELCDERCITLTDRAQIENVILNMCVNAKDAMPLGGTLTISSKVRDFSGVEMPFESKHAGTEFAEIHITDTGAGIPENIKDQIFDPFFTTKERTKGTGLGLSTAHGFIRQSGGGISVDSQEGRGTTFTVYLPLAPVDVEPETAAGRPFCAWSDNYSGTILVVEDNEQVKQVACTTLENAGFDVLSASDGDSGYELFTKHPEIDCVFSDVVMPGTMSGVDLAVKIREQSPNTPVLLATGYTEQSIRDRIAEIEDLDCIAKPYDTNDLPKVINSLVEEARA